MSLFNLGNVIENVLIFKSTYFGEYIRRKLDVASRKRDWTGGRSKESRSLLFLFTQTVIFWTLEV